MKLYYLAPFRSASHGLRGICGWLFAEPTGAGVAWFRSPRDGLSG